MSHKVHHSQGKVPFSWEQKPGVSKATIREDRHSTYDPDGGYNRIKQLSLPPSRPKVIRDNYVHDAGYDHIKQLPLPSPGPKIIRGNNIHDVEYNHTKQLPLPPYRSKITGENQVHDALLLPLPPSGFLPSKISTSRKRLKKQEDPFFTAYRECTKSGNRHKSFGGYKNDGGGFGISKIMSVFSCKHSCSVRDDNMVMLISKYSILSKSQREKRDS